MDNYLECLDKIEVAEGLILVLAFMSIVKLKTTKRDEEDDAQ